MEKKLSMQQQHILDYMEKFGSITTYDAFIDLGITKLTTRISELRQMGFKIGSETICKKNRFEQPIHYNKYFLAEAE